MATPKNDTPMTGLLVAMKQEMACLESSGLVSGGACVCALTGIGKVNAAASAVEMILKHHPSCIINTGVAGGMLPDMRMMDIVVGERVAYHDVWCGEGSAPGQVQGQPQYFTAAPELLEAARTAASGGADVRFGLISSGDQFFISMEEDARIRSLYPDVLACDMESAAIAQVCRRHAVPFISIRYISDVHTSIEVQKCGYDRFLANYRLKGFDYLKDVIRQLQEKQGG